MTGAIEPFILGVVSHSPWKETYGLFFGLIWQHGAFPCLCPVYVFAVLDEVPSVKESLGWKF